MNNSFVYTAMLVGGIFCTNLYYSAHALSGEKVHGSHQHGETRKLDKHEHGASVLEIAAEKNMILMELRSPADDIVGFEHAPENVKQEGKVSKALAVFKGRAGLFTPSPEAKCKITKNSVEFVADEASGHAGFHVKWQMSCSNLGKIKNLSTSFFKLFPKAEEIEVQVVSDAGQKVIEWVKDKNGIKLTLSE